MQIFKTGVGQYHWLIPGILILQLESNFQIPLSHSILELCFHPSGIFWEFSDFYQKFSLPGVDTVPSTFQDFYFENEIEFLKTDFTKSHFIIFMIFVNFWIAFQDTSIFSHSWSFRYFPRYRELIQVFHFSLSPYFFLSLPQTRSQPARFII